jgi:hypothetical protein
MPPRGNHEPDATEIVSLATVIDAMMSCNRTRTGHSVFAQSKRKLTTTDG